MCGANAQAASNLCVFHDPAKAKDGQRARRAGGIARSRPAVLPANVPDVQLGTCKDVSNLLAASISQFRRGELDPRVSNAIGYLSGILLKALEQSELAIPRFRHAVLSRPSVQYPANSSVLMSSLSIPDSTIIFLISLTMAGGAAM